MNNSKKITAFGMLVIIVVCMSGYIQLANTALIKLGFIPSTQAETALLEDTKSVETTVNSEKVSRYQAFLKLKDSIEGKFNQIAFKTTFVEANGWLCKVIGVRYETAVNNVGRHTIRLNNNHLTVISDEPYEKIDIHAHRVVSFYEKLKDRGIEFFYVGQPLKVSPYDNQLPDGIFDCSNSEGDIFLNVLEQENVPYVDLRKEIQMSGIDHYSMFFRTDHHMTTEGGFWAAGVVMNKFLPQYKHGDIDFYDINNYDITVYENSFLGSHGRRTGALYAGIDDFSLLTPRFDTNLSVTRPHEKEGELGSFAEMAITDSPLKDELYLRDMRQMYIPGSAGVHVRNTNGNGKKCLVIGDSLAHLVFPFMALDFSETDRYDARSGGGTAMEYIDEFQPDVVVMMYYPHILSVPEMFVFE